MMFNIPPPPQKKKMKNLMITIIIKIRSMMTFIKRIMRSLLKIEKG